MSDRELRIERTYQAPIERVFDAWTSEEVMARWWRAETHFGESEAEVDLRVGGAIRVVMHDPVEHGAIGGGGVYTEVDRPNRLAFTWLWDAEPHRTLIQIDFEEAGEATTLVRFVHSGLWDEDAVRRDEHGWNGVLANLVEALGAD